MMIFFDERWVQVGQTAVAFQPPCRDSFEGMAICAKDDPKLSDQMDGDLWYQFTQDILHVSSAGQWVGITFK